VGSDCAVSFPEITGLRDFWARQTGRAPMLPMTQAERVLLCLLGIGIEQGLIYLHRERPEFEAFCDWVLGQAGPPDPVEVARFNAWQSGAPCSPEAAARLAALAAMPAVLDAADLAQWDAHGFVVLRSAISRAEANAAAAVLWNHIEARPDDPESWYNPKAKGLWVPLYHAPELAVARQSLRVRKAFAQLHGTPDLWLLTDRTSFNPPERPDAPFQGSPLHWDTSLTPPIPFAVQAILYLTDTAADQGALRLVPGFHLRIAEWLARLGDADPRAVDLNSDARTVPADAGDLIIWRQDLPHGASPNRAGLPRLAQYLTMIAGDAEDVREWR
jgi:Phytanoyl-CoA dioxygenase (PhyH)